MHIMISSDENNQNYYCMEYDQNSTKCIHTTSPKVTGNIHFFEILNRHSIVVEYRKLHAHGISNVEMCSVNVDSNLRMGLMTAGVCKV